MAMEHFMGLMPNGKLQDRLNGYADIPNI